MKEMIKRFTQGGEIKLPGSLGNEKISTKEGTKMKHLIRSLFVTASVFCLMALSPLKSYSTDPTAGDPTRIVNVFHYANGIMTSVFNKDNDTYSNYVNGKMMTTTLGSVNGPMTFQATYDANGFIVSSVNQYGDVTKYNALGQQTETDHTVQDYSDGTGVASKDGNPNTAPAGTAWGSPTTQYTFYTYNTAGQLTDVVSTSDDKKTVQSAEHYDYSGSFMIDVKSFNSSAVVSNGQVTDMSKGLTSITTFTDGKQDTTTSYGADGTVSGVTKTTFDATTGRETDVSYAADGKTLTGTTFYDQYNRQSYTTDMSGQITSEIQYSGAMRTAQLDYANKMTTHFDQYGNQKFQDNQWTPTVGLKDPTSSTQYDPWTQGTLAVVQGHLCLEVDPSQVSNTFYSMNPELLTGTTQKTADGKLIFMISCDDKTTQAALSSMVGQQVKLMWQYYTKSSDSQASGYGWLHLAATTNAAVAYHLANDNQASVDQGGFNWNGTTQYAVKG